MERSCQLVYETCRKLKELDIRTVVLLALDGEEQPDQSPLENISNSCDMLIPVDVSSLMPDREKIAVEEWSRGVREILKYFVESLVSCLSPLDLESESPSSGSDRLRELLDTRSNFGNVWGAGFGETPDTNGIIKACNDALDMAERQTVPIESSQRILLEFGPELTMAEVRTGIQIFQKRLYDQANVIFTFRGPQTRDSEPAPSRVVIFADRPLTS